MLSVKAICEKCSEHLVLNSSTVQKETLQCLEDREILQVVSYVCKKCGALHMVQVDDSVTSELLTELSKLMRKAAEKKKGYDGLSRKEVKKLSKLRKQLLSKRNLLKQTYQGKHYLGDDLEEKEFRFSMYD